MAFTASNMNAAALLIQMNSATFYTGNAGTSWAADSILCALYGNTGTPNKNDTLANNVYNVSQWVSGTSGTNEVYQAGQWAQGGIALGTKTATQPAGFVQFGAATVTSGSAATLAAVYGCFIYDNTLTTKYGYCWNYFGGSQSVTAGTFSVVWGANGIMQVTIN